MTTPAVVVVAEPAAPAVVAPTPAPIVTAPVAVQLAPEPAPVAAPVVATPTAPEVATVSYDPTGDAGLDVALAFVGRLGIALDHPAMKATESGDFSLLKAHLAAMGDKATGWEQHVALGEQSYARTAAAAEATAQAVQATVVSVAGSAEAWSAIQLWASQNATPAEKAEINAMFDSGNVGARAAATILRDAYSKAAGTVVKPASPTRDASAGAVSTDPNGPLSNRDYGAAVRELRQKLGNQMDRSPEYAALRARLKTS